MSTFQIARDQSVRISADRNSVYFWKERFDAPVTVKLDGQPIDFVCEARSGERGFVVATITDEHGTPRLADVVLDGKVIDQVIANRRLIGRVEIIPGATAPSAPSAKGTDHG